MRVFGMGVGKAVDQTELVAIATDADHTFQAESFKALEREVESIKQEICDGRKTVNCS